MPPNSNSSPSTAPASSGSSGSDSAGRVPFHESLPLALALFAFWIVLSGKLDLFHLGAGAIAALATAGFTVDLYSQSPPLGPRRRHPFAALPLLRLALYAPWLIGQIVTASVQVAKIVLRPRMEVRPRVFRFEAPLPHNLARATLANSITLTPGTVTIDVLHDEYLVHALTRDAAESLTTDEPGNMKARVAFVFESDSRDGSS